MKYLSCLALLAFLSACGKEDAQLEAAEQPPVTQSPPSTGTVLLDCSISAWEESVEGCATVEKEGVVLASRRFTGTGIELIGTKKNAGTGGTRWFDAHWLLEVARDFILPREIPATGNAGNGQKLYVLFNDAVDCVWYSHASTRYRNPRCFTGATRAPGNSVGFTGGTEVGNANIRGVTKVRLHVNGSSGNGVVTTVNAAFLYL